MNTKNKTILYLCDFPIDYIGGAQKSLLTMASEMKKTNYNVVITSDIMINPMSKLQDTYTIEQWKKPHNKYMSVISKILFLNKCIKKYKPDIIHIQFSQFAYAFLLGKKYKILKKVPPTIFTDRHYFTGYNKRYQKMFIENSRLFDALIFTTENNMTEWKNALNSHEIPKMYIVNNVLESKWFEKNNMNIKNKSSKINVGFAGRYVDWKRWDTAFEIAKILCETDKYTVSIAISPVDNDTEMNRFLDNMKIATHNNLKILISADEDEMLNFYQDLDFFILTSEHESFGRTLIEAMTQNTVVLSTNSGGAPEVVARKDVLFHVGDARMAYEIIEKISYSEEKMNEYKNWFLYHSKNFSIGIMRDKMNNIYKSLLQINK